MTKLTRSGIAHDLTISPYKFTIKYDENDQLTFVFSSEFYLNKFESKIKDHRTKINSSISQRFGFNIKLNKLADIKLYEKTETRGFLIRGKEDDYSCISTIELDGKIQILKS